MLGWNEAILLNEAPNNIITINPFHLCQIVRFMFRLLLWHSKHYVVTLGSPYFRALLAVPCFIYKRARVSGACLSIGNERTNDQWECGQRGSVSLALSEFSRILSLELPKCLPVSLSSPKMDFLDKRLKEPLRFLAKVGRRLIKTSSWSILQHDRCDYSCSLYKIILAKLKEVHLNAQNLSQNWFIHWKCTK